MNAVELESLLNRLPTFHGVWACDRLKYFRFHGRGSIIVNTQPRWQPGLHWVVFAWDENHLYYMDTSGIVPIWHHSFDKFIAKHVVYKNCIINTRIIQEPNTKLCGQFCAFFVSLFDCGYTLSDFIGCFSNNLEANNRKIEKWWCWLTLKDSSTKIHR